MKGTSSAGILLLLIGAMAFIGFLTGNLDRWLEYLFSPGKPPLSGAAAVATGGVAGAVTAGTNPGSVGSAAFRQTA